MVFIKDEQMAEPVIKDKKVMKEEKSEQHEASIASRVYSNDLSHEVETVCRICWKKIRVSKMRHHTANSHKINIKAYKEKFGNHKQDLVREVYHKCGICEIDILLDSDYIKNHSYDIHGIKQSVYNSQYLVPRKNKNGKVYAQKQKQVLTPVSVLETLEEIANIVNNFW